MDGLHQRVKKRHWVTRAGTLLQREVGVVPLRKRRTAWAAHAQLSQVDEPERYSGGVFNSLRLTRRAICQRICLVCGDHSR
jgi:hypothetical protein